MYTGEIAVSVGECRIDLNRPCVTLETAVDVSHLLQSIAHIRVRIGESWRNPNGLFVVKNGFTEFALLLQDTRQIRMSCRKLRKDLKSID